MNIWHTPNKKFVPTPVLSIKSINTNYSMQEGFPSGLIIKNLSAVEETWVWFLGWENPMWERMFTHSSILAWRIPWTEEAGRLQSMVSQRVRQTKVTEHTSTVCRTHTFSYNQYVIHTDASSMSSELVCSNVQLLCFSPSLPFPQVSLTWMTAVSS